MTGKVITICGSLKFQKEMIAISEQLELEGNCVFSVVYPAREPDSYSIEELAMLGAMHRKKIRRSDAILVVNVGGYIGSSTRQEIAYARSLGKEIFYYTDL